VASCIKQQVQPTTPPQVSIHFVPTRNPPTGTTNAHWCQNKTKYTKRKKNHQSCVQIPENISLSIGIVKLTTNESKQTEYSIILSDSWNLLPPALEDRCIDVLLWTSARQSPGKITPRRTPNVPMKYHTALIKANPTYTTEA
jgi:hypothetical protein